MALGKKFEKREEKTGKYKRKREKQGRIKG
jgi:hypothetical protein